MRLFPIIKLALVIIGIIAPLTVVFITPGSPTAGRVSFVISLNLGIYFAMLGWEVRHTRPRHVMLFGVGAGLSLCAALLKLFF